MTDSTLKTSRGLRRREALALLPAALAMPWPVLAQTDLSDLARIRANGALKVAVYKDNAPFSSGPATDMTGLDVSLAEALARQMNLKLSLLPFDAGENMNDDLRNMVWRGHYLGYGPADVMLQVPADRFLANGNPQVTILAPYMRQSNVLLHDSRRLAAAATPEDLKGLPLAAERGAGAASVLMGYGGGLLRNQVSIYPSGVEAAQAVIDGKAAAAFVLRAQAEAALFQRKASVEQFPLSKLNLNNGIADTGWPVGMAIKAAHKDLGAALDTAMKSLRESGELLAMFKQHGLTLTAP
ncbi:substrate-binding periplasmic protein [Hydrogenophaga pseudoflava]|uniref:Cystine transporter subunit n=1 Tax=Hydrogenophaga pseudoflava TaxID=47421 RepID=A0A4P6X3R4_HYDPS|nr:transporter substrate-binding domain-containing protein [Hydrogenophaga pseudoflava]QBM29485.1 cystine transporter subunit [Hydrogenophaga pseudoflava]